MICPMCITSAALAMVGASTSGGAAAMALRILRWKRRVKPKPEARFPNLISRRARDRHISD